MSSSWFFERISEGLTYLSLPMSHSYEEKRHQQGKEKKAEKCEKLSPNTCQSYGAKDNIKHIAKVDYSSTLFSVSGEKLQSKADAECAVTWRSHHAFSARCAQYLLSTLRAQQKEETGECVEEEKKQEISKENDKINTTNKCWRIGFYLKAATTEPHILLSVAPRYCTLTPSSVSTLETCSSASNNNNTNLLPTSDEEKEMCDKRIMETPLIWEEPYALSIECTQHGCFAWSDHWGMFNKPLKSVTQSEYEQTHAQKSKMYGIEKNDYNNNEETMGVMQKSEETSKAFERLVELKWNQPESTTSHNSTNQNTNSTLATLSVNVYEPTLPLTSLCSLLSSSNDILNMSAAITQTHAKLRYSDEFTLPVDLHASSTLQFTPYVTLLEAGDEATIIDTV